MKHEPHAPTHVTPPPVTETHIHHEPEPTILARWLQQGMEQGPIFWVATALVVAGIGALVFYTNRQAGAGSKAQEAWSELAAISDDPTASLFNSAIASDVPEQLEEVASAHPDTTAAAFARLQAASILLREASGELASTRRTDAVGKLLEADELFNDILAKATEPTIRRIAAFGAARSAEARLGLSLEDSNRPKPSEVVALYEKVVADFPNTPEADRAKQLATRLGDEDSLAFYDRLAKFDPDAVLIPPPPGSPSSLMPGSTLAPGESGGLMDLLKQGSSSSTDLPAPIDIPAPTPPVEEAIPPVGAPTEPTPPPTDRPKPETAEAPAPVP